jgi:hypothetical protein
MADINVVPKQRNWALWIILAVIVAVVAWMIVSAMMGGSNQMPS